MVGSENRYDAVLVGAGIMSATLAVLLHELEPDMRLLIVERLERPGLESSAAANNAGTGHAANCELNYTPLQGDGRVSTSRALAINQSFERSLEFWASLTAMGRIEPSSFLHVLPHISFVSGNADTSFLFKRFKQMIELPAFAQMQWSIDQDQLLEWMPLVMEGRLSNQPVAATRVERGTDVDFGALTSAYLEKLQFDGSLEIKFCTEVINLHKSNEIWHLDLQGENSSIEVQSPFVFLGAGGGALSLLQKSGIPEALDFGGFPVSGKWLVCSEPSVTNRHHAKVYGKANVGAPPMSVPHLDSRWISGKRSLLFGPFAGFSTKFLKQGSYLDLIRSINRTNLGPMFQVGLENFDLVKYLLDQLLQTNQDRMLALKGFFPKAIDRNWRLSVAGQRVQIIKSTPKGGILQMGTEVVTSGDGSLAALLGASPGASTAVTIMLEVLQRCWGERMTSQEWQERLRNLLPTIGKDPNADLNVLLAMRQRSDSLLGVV